MTASNQTAVVNSNAALVEGLCEVLGLIQLIEARADLPADLRLALLGNHRLIAARAALQQAEAGDEPR